MRKPSPIDSVEASAYRIPTPEPESDGTLEWRATTLVVCRLRAGGDSGIGYTYASGAAATLIREHLNDALTGLDSNAPRALWLAAWRSVRNLGRPGLCSMAMAAVDMAAWDLFSRRLGQPLYRALGAYRDSVAAYGSGGFTSYSDEQLRQELAQWNELGLGAAKIKIGRDADADPDRIAIARESLGADRQLLVDANGAYGRREALRMAETLARYRVSWFEEPVTSDDLPGLAWLRERGPAGVRIVTGEYGYTSDDFLRLLNAQAVDVLMADATRCAGVTGFLEAAALAAACHTPLSSHCAPTIHAHLGCAARTFVSAEYFHDHVRIEERFFDGAIQAHDGRLTPDPGRPGLGIELKSADLERFAA